MQAPDSVLGSKLVRSAKLVLVAMWGDAEGEPAWTAMKLADIAEATAMPVKTVERITRLLRTVGAVRREVRRLAGRRILGFGLARIFTAPLHPARVRVASLTGEGSSVAKREKAHGPQSVATIETDLAAIAKHARRFDSALQICERLIKAKARCSEGTWHRVKVFRRTERMAGELGLVGKGVRAGEIVDRWKKTRG